MNIHGIQSVGTLTQETGGFATLSGSFTGSFRGDGSQLTGLPSQSFNTSSLLQTASFNAYTASTDGRLSNIEATTASINTSITNLNASSASQQVSINALNVFTASQSTGSIVTSITNLNSATQSLFSSASLALVTASFDNGTRNLTFTKGDTTQFSVNIPDVSGSAGTFVTTSSFNSYTASNDQRVSSLEIASSSLQTFTSSAQISINALNTNSASVNTSINALNTFTASQSTASIITSITNLNSFTSSANIRLTNLESTSASVNISVSNLNSFTSSYYTDSASFNSRINTNTSNITSNSASIATNTANIATNTTNIATLTSKTGSYATTGSNTFVGNEIISGNVDIQGTFTSSLQNGYVWVGNSSGRTTTVATSSFGGGSGAGFPFTGSAVITGSLAITGSLFGSVITLSVATSTASINMNDGNFFVLNIPTGSTTHIAATNIKAGQTLNLLLKQAAGATTGSVAWAPYILFPSGLDMVATNTGSAIDLVSMISFDTTNLMAANVKNLA